MFFFFLFLASSTTGPTKNSEGAMHEIEQKVDFFHIEAALVQISGPQP